MRSLKTKILLMVICIVVIAELFTVTTILYNAKHKTREQAFSNLNNAVSIVDQHMEDHTVSRRQVLLILTKN